jgi:hypothetical protein
MVVHRNDSCGSCGAYVGEYASGRGGSGDGAEVHIVQRRLYGLIEGGVENGAVVGRRVGRCVGGVEERLSWRVPGHTETVDIEQAVASSNLGFCSRLSMDSWVVR